MKVTVSDPFKKDFERLPEPVKKAARKQITQLLLDHRHPSLHFEKLEGYENRWSARVNRDYRISIEFLDDETLYVRRILPHDDLYRQP